MFVRAFVCCSALIVSENKNTTIAELNNNKNNNEEDWKMLLICQTDPTYITYYEAGKIPEVIPVLLDVCVLFLRGKQQFSKLVVTIFVV